MKGLAHDENVNGHGLIQTFVFEFEREMCGVCRDILPGHLTGHIYESAALHSCSSSDSCETSLSSPSPASALAERHCVT